MLLHWTSLWLHTHTHTYIHFNISRLLYVVVVAVVFPLPDPGLSGCQREFFSLCSGAETEGVGEKRDRVQNGKIKRRWGEGRWDRETGPCVCVGGCGMTFLSINLMPSVRHFFFYHWLLLSNKATFSEFLVTASSQLGQAHKQLESTSCGCQNNAKSDLAVIQC